MEESALVLEIIERGSDDQGLMLVVHGYGADQFDLVPLVPYLDPEERYRVVLPRGPVPILGAGAGWYDVGPDGSDHDGLRRSWRTLDTLLTDLCAKYGTDRADSVLIGFSQGAAMVLTVALAGSTPRPQAVVAMSGYLPDVDGIDYAWSEELPPVLVLHGSLDPVVAIDKGLSAAARLEEHGLDVTFRDYPMEHEVSMDSLADARTWLEAKRGERR